MPAARPLQGPLPELQSPATPTAQDFAREGYLVLRNFVSPRRCNELLAQAQDLLHPLSAPVEYESEVHSPAATGKARPRQIPRRLRYAFGRHPAFRAWAKDPALVKTLQELVWPKQQDLWLTQNHHNCIMTKMPELSSETGWHQDIRYWNFEQQDLVTAWLALTPEHDKSGALQVIPQSHRSDLPDDAFDEHRFLRDDHLAGQSLLAKAGQISLQPGDLLLFHCKLLHAAKHNQTQTPKLAIVYSYRRADDRPLPNTRSSRVADLPLLDGTSS